MFNVLYLDYLHNENYIIELKFFDLEDSASLDLKNIVFTVSFKIKINIHLNNYLFKYFFLKFNSYNPAFTKLELWYRFIFLAITFLVLVIFILLYFQIF